MNSKWTIACVILAIITLVSVVYAFVQTVKAQAAEMDALTQKENAENIRKEKEATTIELERMHQLYTICQAELARK